MRKRKIKKQKYRIKSKGLTLEEYIIAFSAKNALKPSPFLIEGEVVWL